MKSVIRDAIRIGIGIPYPPGMPPKSYIRFTGTMNIRLDKC